VGLAVNVVDHLRNVIQDVAIIAGDGIGKIDDVQTANLFLRVDLFRIDGRPRVHNIDHLAHLTLMHQHQLDARDLVEMKIAGFGGIKSFLLDPSFKKSCANHGQCAYSGSAGLAAERLRSVGCGERDPGARDRNTVFVHNGNNDVLLDLNLGMGADQKPAQQDDSALRYAHGRATEAQLYCLALRF
jgi:hypothetical protein